LIELLVVIAIVSGLASLLLPALASARERARRIYCLSNEKQLYLSCATYADDMDDRLPARTDGSGGLVDLGSLYTELANSPVRYFLRDYCGANIGMGHTTAGFFKDHKAPLWCPSARGGGVNDALIYESYAFYGFGWYPTGTPCASTYHAHYGTTRLSMIGDTMTYRYGATTLTAPKVMLMDLTYNETYSRIPAVAGNNHAWQGANVLAGDGSGAWYGRRNLIADHPGGTGPNQFLRPLGFFLPVGGRLWINCTDNPVALGYLYVYLPDGTSFYGSADAGRNAAIRQLFGYAQ